MLKYTMLVYSSLNYNQTERHGGEFSGIGTYHYNQHIALQGGYRFTTGLTHTLKAGTIIFFPIKKSHIFLENQYLWEGWTKYNIQEFNALLMVGATCKERWSVKVGIFNKFFTTIHHVNHNPDWLFEPLNFAYSVEWWILKTTCRFNTGLQLCNVEDFITERPYSPSLLFNFRYRLNNRWTFYGNIRFHNTGVFDCTNNFYENTFKLGAKVSW